ncbi:retroviral-like aspartic protease, partial [Streptomyces albiflaviniger]|nr:retroviral-like aspartic protease [Streptomyces albiflaviniger]
KNPGIEGGNEAAYEKFINQVAIKVRELENDYRKLSEKLPAKLDDIFEPTVKINVGVNEIAALCDLGESVSTIPKSLFDRLNLGSFTATKLKLHLADSTFKQVVGIKENIVVQIKGCPTLIDLVIVDMPEDPIAPII